MTCSTVAVAVDEEMTKVVLTPDKVNTAELEMVHLEVEFKTSDEPLATVTVELEKETDGPEKAMTGAVNDEELPLNATVLSDAPVNA
jgi:hypothetical protein